MRLALVLGLLAAVVAGTDARAATLVGVEAPAEGVVGEVVEVVVTAAGADAARLTLPDLQGTVSARACSRAGSPPLTRFVLPYRPLWPGRHVLVATALAGACSAGVGAAWRPVVIDVAPAPARPAAATAGDRCGPAASAIPLRRHVAAAREAVLCLLAAARAARGLPALAPEEPLRALASRRAHRPRRRGLAGEQVTSVPGALATPERVVGAWLAGDARGRDLLDPALTRIGVCVVAHRGRLGATYVVVLR